MSRIALFVAALAIVALTAPAASAPRASSDPVVDALRRGGHVVFLRHGDFHGSMAATGCGRSDRLTDHARHEATTIRDAFDALNVPVGYVASAPECVPLEAARRAFGKAEARRDLALLNRARSAGERTRLTRGLGTLLGTRPPSGLNTVVVGHLSNVRAAARVEPGPSEALVFRPRGAGRFTLVARVPVADWAKLMEAHPRRD